MTFREPAQNPPDEQSPIAIDPRSMSTLEACFFQKVEIRKKVLMLIFLRTYGNIVKFGQTASGPSNGTKRETLVKDQTIFILQFELNLKQELERKKKETP